MGLSYEEWASRPGSRGGHNGIWGRRMGLPGHDYLGEKGDPYRDRGCTDYNGLPHHRSVGVLGLIKASKPGDLALQALTPPGVVG